MKLKAYIESLKKLDGELEVIFSSDNEGNSFEPVFYAGTEGYYYDGMFAQERNFFSPKNGFSKGIKPTKVVCIN